VLIVIFEVSPNTFEGTGSLNTYLTPDVMLYEYSIHIQAKAVNAQSSLVDLANFQR